MVSPWFPPLKGTLDTSHRIMLPSNMKPMDFFFQRFQVSNSEASGKFSPFAAAETLTSKSRPQKLECCRKLQLDCCTFVSVGVTPQEMPHNDKISDGNQWIYSWESKGTPIEPPPHDNGDYNRIYSLNAALFVGGVALPEYPHIDSHDLWLPHLETHPLVFEPSPMFHSSSMTMATEHISSEDVFWVSVSASNLQCIVWLEGETPHLTSCFLSSVDCWSSICPPKHGLHIYIYIHIYHIITSHSWCD